VKHFIESFYSINFNTHKNVIWSSHCTIKTQDLYFSPAVCVPKYPKYHLVVLWEYYTRSSVQRSPSFTASQVSLSLWVWLVFKLPLLNLKRILLSLFGIILFWVCLLWALLVSVHLESLGISLKCTKFTSAYIFHKIS